MIDWTAIITALIGLVAGGGLSYFLFYSIEKRKANAEADKTEVEVGEKKINNELALAAEWKKLYEDTRQDNQRMDEKIDSLEKFHDKRYGSLEKQYDELYRISEANKSEISDLKKKAESNKVFICYDLNCPVRKRKQSEVVPNETKSAKNDKA